MKFREPKKDPRKGDNGFTGTLQPSVKERLCYRTCDTYSVSKDRGKIVVDPKTGPGFRVMQRNSQSVPYGRG